MNQGSEAPVAQTLDAICDYALKQQDSDIDTALQLLRNSDAKQRLTYALNRAASLDIKNENWKSAITRATEALENAEIMDRPSEVITARAILAEAYQCQSDSEGFNKQMQALLDTPQGVGAKWARNRAAKLIENFRSG